MLENSFVYENIYTIEERKQLIADSLKGIRKSKNMTQKQVADIIGINTQTYATYERGRNEAPAEIIIRLSYLYNLPTDILLQRDNVTKDKKSIMEQLDSFNEVIDKMKGQILSGDPKTREEIGRTADAFEKIFDIVRESIDKIK